MYHQQVYEPFTMYNPNSLRLQPEALAGYVPYTHSQQYLATPTSSEWGSYPSSPCWGPANDPYPTVHVHPARSRSNSGVLPRPPLGLDVHKPFVPTTPTMVPAPVPAMPTVAVETKKYRHDPYASGSEQSTPPCSPASTGITLHPPRSDTYAGSGTMAPVYDPSFAEVSSLIPVSSSVEEQFTAVIGTVAQTACSPRGRNLLLNVIRLQHLDKIQIIVEELCADLSNVLSEGQGCHVLRFLVDYLQPSHVDLFMRTLTPELLFHMATHSQHSRRVLQCLVEQHKTAAIQPMINLLCVERLAADVSRTQQGCIAIMRILENVLPAQKEMLFNALAPYFPELSVDQFGNYAVQTAIQQFDASVLSKTFQQVFAGQFVRVSCNKFGSNVMEKMVSKATPQLLSALLQQLCFNDSNLQKLMQDGFGNFVLQALVEASANTPDGRRICDAIRPHLHASPYGHKIEGKLRSKRLLASGFNEANIRGNPAYSASCGDCR